MESRQIVLHGLASRYYSVRSTQSGPSSNRPILLFLHGWRSEGKVWGQVMEGMGQRGFDSFSLDLAGFGSSETPPLAWDLQDYCDMVSEFVKKMELPKVVLIGHSFGGRITIQLSSDNPTWLAKLILVDSHGFHDVSAMRQLKWIVAKVVKPLFVLKFLQSLRRKIYSLIGAEDYLATPALQQTFLNVIHKDLQVSMTTIRKPALLIWGNEDKDTPVEFGRRMQTLIADSKLKVIGGAGHYSFLDQPQEFNEALVKFLNSQL